VSPDAPPPIVSPDAYDDNQAAGDPENARYVEAAVVNEEVVA
jgi:hypothetical protein